MLENYLNNIHDEVCVYSPVRVYKFCFDIHVCLNIKCSKNRYVLKIKKPTICC